MEYVKIIGELEEAVKKIKVEDGVTVAPLDKAIEELKTHCESIEALEKNLNAVRAEVIDPIREELNENKRAGKFSILGFIVGVFGCIVTSISLLYTTFFPPSQSNLGNSNWGFYIGVFGCIVTVIILLYVIFSSHQKYNYGLNIDYKLIGKEEEKIKIVSNLIELNEKGCSFFLKEHGETCIASESVRWLTKNKNQWISRKQKEANNHIDKYIDNRWKLDNIKVLLYEDPTKQNQNHIVRLIRAGANVKFKETDNTARICLSGNELFVSYSANSKNHVKTGVYYFGNLKYDPMIEHYKNIFNKDFETARKIIVNNNGNLSFEDTV